VSASEITLSEIHDAVARLRRSERGRDALVGVRDLLCGGGLGLDAENRHAVILLLYAAFENHPQTVRDLVTEATEAGK